MTVMNTETERPPGGRGRYPKEFRRDAEALVIDRHRTVANVARELGVAEQTLGSWVNRHNALGERLTNVGDSGYCADEVDRCQAP